MKKRIIIIAVFLVLTLVGCTNKLNKENIKKGTETVENVEKQEIEKANDKEIAKNENNHKEEANEKDNRSKEETQKQLYINKLDDIELGLKKLSKKYEGTTQETKEAAGEEYNLWDDALNEIYGVLKTQLPENDMKRLKEKQIQWISNKEKKAREDSLEFKGGTMEPLVYTASLAKTTKDRCYELVEEYMK